jgi:hypothetical protein
MGILVYITMVADTKCRCRDSRAINSVYIYIYYIYIRIIIHIITHVIVHIIIHIIIHINYHKLLQQDLEENPLWIG